MPSAAIGHSGLHAKVITLKPAHCKTIICGLWSMSVSRKLTPAAPAPAALLRLLAYSPYSWTATSANVSVQHLTVDLFTYCVPLSHVQLCTVQSSGLTDSAHNSRVKPDVTRDAARQSPTRQRPQLHLLINETKHSVCVIGFLARSAVPIHVPWGLVRPPALSMPGSASVVLDQ